jgi:fibronectin-binding autotransporter adhesin
MESFMRPASSRVLTLSISVLCLLAALFSNSQASAQTLSKRKLSKQAAAAGVAVAKSKPAAGRGAPPPLTSDTWSGTAGDGQWTTAGNWSAGVPSSSDAVTIGGTAAVTLANNQTGSFGTLTLSTSGDTVTVDNNALLEASGNISNAGTITMSADGNSTQLYLENSLTLSGTGTVNLNSGNGQYTGYIDGVSGSVLTTSSNITGAGTVGNGQLNLVNSGTINGNISGQNLNVNPDTCTGCTSTNTGTLEATGGGILTLDNGTWTQSGAGKITAGTGSTVNLTSGVSITGGTLSTAGTGVIYDATNQTAFLTNVTNTGTYVIQNNAITEVNGTLTNTGTITVNAGGNSTQFYLTGNTTLSGSGTVVLTSTDNQWTGYIDGVSGAVLTNESTITGWGTIGNGTLVLANASNGVINSNISGGNITLNPYTSSTSTNAGLMEATNGGTLTMNNGTWTNTGTIQAAAGSSVVLNSNVSITGGTLESIGTGTVISAANQDVFLTGLTLAGTFDIQNNNATEINGTITNNGVINLQGTGNTTELYVTGAGTGTATLAGTGSIVLGTGGGNQFSGVGGTSLIIDQNVSGVGNIGAGVLTLTNNSTIDANISPTVSTAPLYIQAGAGGMANNSILEATNGGNLTLTGGTITNGSHGIIEALGADSSGNASTVILTSGVTVSGGTLTTTGAGVIAVEANNTAYLTTLTNSGTLNVQNNGQIDSTGTITNNGTITLQAAGNTTYFYSPNATTLTGTGTLVLSSTNGQYSGFVDMPGGLTNNSTITGAGALGSGPFTNNGTVNANVNGQTLNMSGFTSATNTKTLEASGGGTLEFNGSSWNNAGGTITAQANSSVELTGNTTITGGTLNTSGTGSQIYVEANNVANLTTLTNNGTLNVQNNGQIDASGTITNNGTITLQAAGNTTYYYAPVATTLTGTGTLVLTSSNGQYTGNLDGAGGFTNDETITGAGLINQGTFTNNGTINANISAATLTLQSFTAATNTKTMEASGGGTMEFNGSSWTNTGGIIEAETGSGVNLTGNTTITGGTLTTAGTGAITVLANNDANLASLTNSGTLNIQNNTQTQLTGAITNTGTITLQASGNSTYLMINGAVTLSGAGTINLSSTNGQYSNLIYGVGTAPTLNSFNTIEGAGNIGSSNMGFTNSGTLDANIAGQVLAINVNSSGFTNYNGTNTTLTGGTYIANGGDITFAAGNNTGITTLAASATEENGGQILNTTNNSNALANLTGITSAGSLTIGGVAFTDAGSFSNAGSLTLLSGESFTIGSLAQIVSGKLTAGTYVLDANLNLSGSAQTITMNAANLTLAGGTIENTSNTTNALAGLASNTGKLTIAGTSNAVSTTASSFSNTGTLTINAGDSFTAHALTQLTGSNTSKTLAAGTYVLGGNLDLSTNGLSITTNSANLTLEGGTIKSGSANALAALANNTANLTIAGTGKNVSTTAASFSNTGTLTIDKNDSFTAGNLTQISSGTLTAGNYVLAGNLDLTTAGISITTNSTNLTLEGGTINSNSVNALSALAANTANLTIAGTATAVSTTAASFSNTGTLTINKGDSFTAPALTQISGNTLTAGTYVLAGNLDLTAAATITTNSALLTLEGGTIQTGTTNDLATLSSNTGTLNLASDASVSTSSSLANTGTVDVAKGSTLTVSGTGNTYTQTAGTTTVDGTLAGIAGGASVTGGTILGAGSVHGNLSVGNATGAAATINVGDTGAAGLLSITGTYTQLATANMTGFINGTVAGTGFSQLKVTGTASLGGTINFTVSSSFQASLTVGEKFTVLTASALNGTKFSNSTIAINATLQFDVTYTATGVVLQVEDVAPSAPASSSTAPAQIGTAAKPVNGLRQHIAGTSQPAKPILVAASAPHSNATFNRGSELSGLRSWEHVVSVTPATSTIAKPVMLTKVATPANSVAPHNNLATPNVWVGQGHGVPSTLDGMGMNNNRRVPVKIMTPSLPRMLR